MLSNKNRCICRPEKRNPETCKTSQSENNKITVFCVWNMFDMILSPPINLWKLSFFGYVFHSVTLPRSVNIKQLNFRWVTGVKRNFWLAGFLTSRHVRKHRVIFYISHKLRKLMIRDQGLVFRYVCRVRVRKKNWGLRISPTFLSGYSYSRTVACVGYLTPNQKVLICTTHIKNVNANLIPFLWEAKNWQRTIGQKISQRSEISLDTGDLHC